MLNIKFYGTRGNIPVAEKDYMEYGGNTTCIRLYQSDNNRYVILDAGTGIRKLGEDLMKEKDLQEDIHVVFTHFHSDHIQGFPFFAPAYKEGQTINVLALGKDREINDLRHIFSTQMIKEYFPIGMNQMGANINFLYKKEDLFEHLGSFAIARLHDHPGGCMSYRFERNGKIIVVCTDIEYKYGIDEESIRFAKDADLLIHDAHFTDEELQERRGYGHSSHSQAMELAEKAGVKQLIMTHHHPDHNDEMLREIEKKCQERMPNCLLAKEGMEVDV
ncbi:MAG: MBL fold metallo-hydrolase [Flavobacteriales bacterium]|nr:MBL fold metallo-hydrolase [Flavobacteriales bacterium]